MSNTATLPMTIPPRSLARYGLWGTIGFGVGFAMDWSTQVTIQLLTHASLSQEQSSILFGLACGVGSLALGQAARLSHKEKLTLAVTATFVAGLSWFLAGAFISTFVDEHIWGEQVFLYIQLILLLPGACIGLSLNPTLKGNKQVMIWLAISGILGMAIGQLATGLSNPLYQMLMRADYPAVATVAAQSLSGALWGSVLGLSLGLAFGWSLNQKSKIGNLK